MRTSPSFPMRFVRVTALPLVFFAVFTLTSICRGSQPTTETMRVTVTSGANVSNQLIPFVPPDTSHVLFDVADVVVYEYTFGAFTGNARYAHLTQDAIWTDRIGNVAGEQITTYGYSDAGDFIIISRTGALNNQQVVFGHQANRTETIISPTQKREELDVYDGTSPSSPNTPDTYLGHLSTTTTLSDSVSPTLLIDQMAVASFTYSGNFTDTVQSAVRDLEAHYRYEVTKLHYKITIPANATGKLRWLEVFTPDDDPTTPADESAKKEYRAMSWDITPGATETPVYTIDPLGQDSQDANAAYRHPDVNGQYDVVPFTLDVAVDADRDGGIITASEGNSDATSADKPYRFWLNDDIDASVTYTNADQLRGIIGNLANLIPDGGGVYETEQDDQVVTDSSQEDWHRNTVACKRDLEDFVRIVVSVSGITDALKSGDLYLGLKWANTTGTPAIKLYKQYDAAGGQSYVTDDYQASVQLPELALLNYNYPNDDRSSASAHTTVETSEVFVIAPGIWFGLTDSAPKRSLLFEGCKAGSGQLKLVILKRQNDTYTEIGEGGGVWLDLKEPKEFIERWSCGDGDRTAIGPLQRLDAKSGTFSAPTQDWDKDYVLYVHGYNMQENEKQRWLETTYKRLWHLGYKGRVGGFSWPCSQTAPPYDDSENHAWQSGARLAELLANLKAQGFRVHLLAHSQGNVVSGEALRLAGAGSQVVRTYVASQAAIAGHSYDSSLESRTDFTPSTPDVYSHYYLEGQNPAQSTTLAHTWPSTNPSYMAPSRMTGAAVKYVNFWNADDYALTGNSLSHPGWMIDQAIKPTVYPTGYNLDHGFYYYDPFTMPSPIYWAFPDDRFTIFAIGVSARSRALGATQTGGVFAANPSFDLKASLSYGTEHIYHSAEFRSSMAQRWQYWNRFLIEAGLKSPQ